MSPVTLTKARSSQGRALSDVIQISGGFRDQLGEGDKEHQVETRLLSRRKILWLILADFFFRHISTPYWQKASNYVVLSFLGIIQKSFLLPAFPNVTFVHMVYLFIWFYKKLFRRNLFPFKAYALLNAMWIMEFEGWKYDTGDCQETFHQGTYPAHNGVSKKVSVSTA